MPREQRKRGKKHRTKLKGDEEEFHEENFYEETGSKDATVVYEDSPDAPFGVLDPDLKAYFRTVNDQLRAWQDEGISVEVDAEIDANEERRLFFKAALTEMSGKELALATDPECSPILERMLYSMDDFARRVFTDCLAGSWIALSNNRFSSHVCQTLLTLAADTVSREARGMHPPSPQGNEDGELLTMTQLILDACEDILSDLENFVQSAFTSHVLRALLSLLAPSMLPYTLRPGKHAPTARSKKSAIWKARQGVMKAILPDQPEDNAGKATGARSPISFTNMAKTFLKKLQESTNPNEMRALAVNRVGSPVLQMFLELEASMGESDSPASIMDNVLAGLISNPDSHKEPSSYVASLVLDATSSHLAESVVMNCSPSTFNRLWKCYFVRDLSKLSTHPVANFVVARAISRLNSDQLGDALNNLEGCWKKSLKLSRLGILCAAVDRAGQLGSYEDALIETIYSTFEIPREEAATFVLCILRLKTYLDHKETSENTRPKESQPNDADDRRIHEHSNETREARVPKVQGSVLLQSVLRMHSPHNEVVLESLHALSPLDLLALACDPTSSRILDVALENENIPLRLRKRLVTSFIGHFHLLVDDRIGSRVADRCWAAADPYLKEKIARSLIPHEQFLAGSHFGRFFTRSLALALLKRNPEQWKASQTKGYAAPSSVNAIPIQTPGSARSSPSKDESKRPTKKRKQNGELDEIDELFSGIGAHKRTKGLTIAKEGEEASEGKPTMTANIESSVLKAIKAAPHDLGASHKKSKKRKKGKPAV